MENEERRAAILEIDPQSGDQRIYEQAASTIAAGRHRLSRAADISPRLRLSFVGERRQLD